MLKRILNYCENTELKHLFALARPSRFACPERGRGALGGHSLQARREILLAWEAAGAQGGFFSFLFFSSLSRHLLFHRAGHIFENNEPMGGPSAPGSPWPGSCGKNRKQEGHGPQGKSHCWTTGLQRTCLSGEGTRRAGVTRFTWSAVSEGSRQLKTGLLSTLLVCFCSSSQCIRWAHSLDGLGSPQSLLAC